ncbi:MAG TPA: tRNA lysidine(34) synthetase TilS [Anaerolineales bacterium]
MKEKVESILREHCLLDAGGAVVVGVSGGVDSLCLMHVLHALGRRLIIAHFDHQLRPESGAEAKIVEATAAALGLPYVGGSGDVRAQAEKTGQTLEEAARHLRYEFLFDTARKQGAVAVAVGHTADDQVETILMHLIRGAGMGGLTGMSFRTLLPQFDAAIPLLRPLLETWRIETLEYCRENGLMPQQDPSNNSSEFFRNRVRGELIPLLQSYNPRVREGLLRASKALASDLALVDEHVQEGWNGVVLRDEEDSISFDADSLRLASVPMQRRLILRAARQLLPDCDIDFETVERAVDFVARAGQKQLDLHGGLALYREGARIYLATHETRPPTEDWPQMQNEVVFIPHGEPVKVPLSAGWSFNLEYEPAPTNPLELIQLKHDEFRVCLDADRLPDQLELRNPRAGDRFQPLGMHGHWQKLSDSMVNEKLPARARAGWPLLCSGDELIWVPGIRLAEPYRLTAQTRRVARLTVSRGVWLEATP